MLQRLDTPASSLPKVGVNTSSIYAISHFSYCEAKNDLKNYQQPNNRILLFRHQGQNVVDALSFSSSIILNNDSWSDGTYSSSPSSDSCYSSSTSASTLIDAISEKPSMITNTINENNQRTFSAECEPYYADQQNENDARNAMDNVTQDQDGLTDDEMTLFGDEVDMEMDDNNTNDDDALFTPLKFIKKKEIHFVNRKSLLSSMLLLHSPPAFASSSTLSLADASSSFTSSCSSNVTKDTNDDVLSSSMKQYVHWENIQNSGPAGRLVGIQNNNSIRVSSSALPIKNSFDTSTSCW